MLVWSETTTFQLLTHDYFATFASKPIANAQETTEVLICLSHDSRAEVDRVTEAAEAAGGRADIRERVDSAFMYNRAFEDPDGLVFEAVYMDIEAAAASMGGQNAEPA